MPQRNDEREGDDGATLFAPLHQRVAVHADDEATQLSESRRLREHAPLGVREVFTDLNPADDLSRAQASPAEEIRYDAENRAPEELRPLYSAIEQGRALTAQGLKRILPRVLPVEVPRDGHRHHRRYTGRDARRIGGLG